MTLLAGGVVVTITPTYSGCPAMREISADVQARLNRAGFERVTVATQLAPPWSSDWITAEGHRKLAAAGIAPPSAAPAPDRPGPADARPSRRRPAARAAARPRPGCTAQFSATACKSLHRCDACGEPFEAVKAAMSPRPDFHRLTVKRVEPLTDDSAAITFAVPRRPGRRVRLRRRAEPDRPPRRRTALLLDLRPGRARRRGSASARSPAGRSPAGSSHALKPGDTLEVQAPSGTFTPDLSVPGRHVLIAAGSGITPMMSIAASVLAADDKSTVTLLYGNRRSDTVMFADEVADLKDAYPARMQIVHVLSREPQEVELYSGRLDASRLTALLPVTVDVAGVDHWWLCGPFGMVTGAIEVLRELGVDPAASTASCSGSATSRPSRRPTRTPPSARAPA